MQTFGMWVFLCKCEVTWGVFNTMYGDEVSSYRNYWLNREMLGNCMISKCVIIQGDLIQTAEKVHFGHGWYVNCYYMSRFCANIYSDIGYFHENLSDVSNRVKSILKN